MENNYKWLRPYSEWVKQKYENMNTAKKREAREALKLVNRAMFPYATSSTNKERMALAVQYLNGKLSIHLLRQQINKKGKLMRISPPVSPNKKLTKRPGATSPIPIKTKTRK
jgi:hypothetical protein